MYNIIHTVDITQPAPNVATVITVDPSVLRCEVSIQLWKDATTPESKGGILSEADLTPSQARRMAMALLAAAEEIEGTA